MAAGMVKIQYSIDSYMVMVNVSVMGVHILSRNYHRSDLSHFNYLKCCSLWLPEHFNQ